MYTYSPRAPLSRSFGRFGVWRAQWGFQGISPNAVVTYWPRSRQTILRRRNLLASFTTNYIVRHVRTINTHCNIVNFAVVVPKFCILVRKHSISLNLSDFLIIFYIIFRYVSDDERRRRHGVLSNEWRRVVYGLDTNRVKLSYKLYSCCSPN